MCYTGVAVRSTAVYYCSDCNFNTLKGSTVRICMENGSWSGVMPQCDCKCNSNNHIYYHALPNNNNIIGPSNQLILAVIIGAPFTVMAVLLLAFFSIMVLCIQHIRRTRKLNDSERKSTNELQEIYEEISHSHGVINTECNMAYATVKLNQ